MNLINNFKNKIKKSKSVLGPFMKTCDPAFVEIAGHAGFDFVILDMEHGPIDVIGLQNLIRAAQCANVLPIVRVQDASAISIARVLDVGAMGIEVPQINSSKQAQDVVNAARYAPNGNRGVCRFVRAADYSAKDRFNYFKFANEILIILQLEGQEAIDNLEEILEVKGFDIIFIGPYDLSQSLGLPGQVDHPVVHKKMKYIIQKAKEKGIVVGTFVDGMESAKLWMEAGVQYISYSVDVGLFYDKCKDIVQKYQLSSR